MGSEIAWSPELWTSAGGEVSPGWDLIPFGDLLQSPKSITVGVMYPGEQTNGGVPLIRVGDVEAGGVVRQPSMSISADVHCKYHRTELCGDELLITLVGTPGVCVLARPEMKGWNVARALAVARLKRPELRPYIKAVLESPVMQNIITGMLNTTVQPTLNLKEIKALPVPIPNNSNTARVLGEVAELFNERIALLQQTNVTLEAIAQALFKSWFVDFDPVRAKAEGRDPEGMDAATAALFPSTFKASELGLIPERWEVSSLGDQLEILSGGTPKTKIPEYWDGEIPWFSVVDAPNEGQVFVFDTERRISQSGLENSPARLMPTNTTIISARGTVGKLALTGQPMAMNQSCYGLRPADGVGEFSTYFSVQRFVTHLQRIAHGAVFDTITRSSFSQAQAVNAPKDVVSAFEWLVGPLMERIHANGGQAITLSQLRDTLLPRLISGKLRLPEAERAIEAATA